jgi:hypothetical protein
LASFSNLAGSITTFRFNDVREEEYHESNIYNWPHVTQEAQAYD